MGHFQTTSPVVLLRASMVASAPPGEQMTTSPSTSGDSAYAQVPGLPPNSLRTFFVHTTLPVAASTHAISPSELSTYSISPSTVGVERAAGNGGTWSGLPTLPMRA